MFIGVPVIFERLNEFDAEKTYMFKNIRLCASGSSILLPSVKHEFENKFDVKIIDRYGTTETGSIASNTLSQSTPRKYGHILPGVKIREEVSGEIAITSPGVFPGYFRNSEATDDRLTDDGWWLTGDIGTFKNGILSLKGRIDDRIIKNGYTIYAPDVEWALLQNSDVKEAKIINIKKGADQNDQVVCFYAGDLSPNEVISYANKCLPHSWRPDMVIEIEEVPKNLTGKPAIARLRELYNTSPYM
jgi:acyl-coenzyme A synthetase/AMP-(fatty) acid ligase